jgi:hypothetical protein
MKMASSLTENKGVEAAIPGRSHFHAWWCAEGAWSLLECGPELLLCIMDESTLVLLRCLSDAILAGVDLDR